MEKLLKDVLERVIPSKEEVDAINKFTKSVLRTANDLGIEATVQGSIAKGTWVSGTHDVDANSPLGGSISLTAPNMACVSSSP